MPRIKAGFEAGVVVYRELYESGRWFTLKNVSNLLECSERTARRVIVRLETILPLESKSGFYRKMDMAR